MYAVQEDNSDFDRVFDAFLQTNRLCVDKSENLWTVTKIKIEENTDKTITINSYDSTFAAVFEKISKKTGKAVIYETLPSQKNSFHIENQTVYEAIKMMLQPHSDYYVKENKAGVQIEKKTRSDIPKSMTDSENEICDISYVDGKFDVNIQDCSISKVLEKIFMYSGESYSNFLQNDEKLKAIVFGRKPLEETLFFILEQINAEAIFSEGIWYLFPKGSRSTGESVTGRSRRWYTTGLKNIPSSRIATLINTKYQNISVTEITGSRLAVFATAKEYEDIQSWLEEIDRESGIQTINLKYIKPEELLKVLPPSISKEDLYDTGTGNSLFFTGSAEKRDLLLELLEEIDRPKKIVRYDLLILQYEKSSSLSWGMSTSIRPSTMGDRTLISGEVGNLLNINFDAITAFGLTFSEKINAAIAENQVSVFADTTLYGLSGEKLTFKNTNTYRYKDAAINSESGKEAFSTITREITSGLVLEIDGWVSGADLITMNINTSVSKQGVDVSKKNGNPPPTSEKTVTTKIVARSGEPVVLSGLSQSDDSESSQGVPFLSKIPWIGSLFKANDVSNTKTELTIYLLPHIEEIQKTEETECWEKKLLDYLGQVRQKGN
ncbi:MAG: hypothetical protein J5710_11915 [Treponema sp.]|nr:hypothetical protein [Treponema sp.]